MSKYSVTVTYTKRYEKTLSVFAKDADEAGDKACDIVSGWDGVEDAEASAVEEE